MLLTLSAKSLSAPGPDGKPLVPLARVATFAREQLNLYGLTLQTSLLAGWDIPKLDRLRDEADKAGAPCLVLVEETPQPFADADPALAAAAVDRAERVVRVAHRLGCSSVAFSLAAPSPDPGVDEVAKKLKGVLANAERMELNLLLAPAKGITETPDQLTTLIRKVGGFRIGSYPDFESASKTKDAAAYLRALTPYASAVCASVRDFDAKGKHAAYDVAACLEAIDSVGFEATLALEFRGKGDPIAALRAARALIDSRLSDPDEMDDVVPDLAPDLEDEE